MPATTAGEQRTESAINRMVASDFLYWMAMRAAPFKVLALLGVKESVQRAMPAEERKAALQGLRAWYYVRELVKYPKDARQSALPLIPEADRRFVVVRLRRWDLLDPVNCNRRFWPMNGPFATCCSSKA